MAHILIVDDSQQDIDNVKKILEGKGHKTSAASDGEQGIKKAKELKPDLIVMDIVMPGLDGFKTTRKLKKQSDIKIPIVVMSSKNQETDKAWAKMQGADEYLVKPVKEAELIAALEKTVG